MSILTCTDVALGYDSNIVASDISFSVNEGDYLCILGRNGSGKSTLVKAIAGLKKPVRGEMKFGEGLSRAKIGYLPQSTDIQKNFPASVWEVVLSGTDGCYLADAPQRVDYGSYSAYIRAVIRYLPNYCKSLVHTGKCKEIAEKNINLLGLQKLKKRSCTELSGGQLQRVLLARALCATTKLLILDEPVAGLDKIVTDELYSIVNELNKKHGITIIMISHDINTALNDSSHILHMDHKPLFFGKTSEYISSGRAKQYWGCDL